MFFNFLPHSKIAIIGMAQKARKDLKIAANFIGEYCKAFNSSSEFEDL